MKSDPNAPPRRGRGRPPKPKDPLSPGTVISPARPRGRPPKDPNAPPKPMTPKVSTGSGKPRGRPRKMARPSGGMSGTTTATRRPRGRPPKVKTTLTENLMDSNNWRPNPPGGEPAMDTGDWRTQLQSDSRNRIVNKIMETFQRHLPFSGEEGLDELKKSAAQFEEKVYTAAISQSDYLRKISLKMLTVEIKSQ